MTGGSEPIESLLLDLHLKRLDAQQAARVEEEVASSPELAAQSGAIREVLELLDRYALPEPPPDLAESVMARIEDQTAILPFGKGPVGEPVSVVPAGTAHDLSASPVLSLRELIAIAACITLFVGIFVPGYFKAQNVARRNLCVNHLRQIATAAMAYAEAHDGYLPYAQYVQGGCWLPPPVRTPNVARASNTRHMFKLMQGGYLVDAQVFICPADPDARPMLADDYRPFADFAEPANNSYSYIFMNVVKPARLEDMQEGILRQMVLLADRNPLIDGRLAHRLSPYDEEGANSPSHEQGAGQNAVYVSGQGGWFTHPTIGVDKDNIYRAGQLVRYQGTEQPTAPTDTFLVP